MERHTIKITISGDEKEVAQKAQAVATLCDYLDAKTLVALAKVVKTEPSKVKIAKQFLGI